MWSLHASLLGERRSSRHETLCVSDDPDITTVNTEIPFSLTAALNERKAPPQRILGQIPSHAETPPERSQGTLVSAGHRTLPSADSSANKHVRFLKGFPRQKAEPARRKCLRKHTRRFLETGFEEVC